MEEKHRKVDWSTAKDALSVIREVMLILLVALLFMWPAKMNEALTEAGISSAFGISFKEQVQETVDSTERLQRDLDAATTELEDISRQMNRIVEQPPSPETRQQLRDLNHHLNLMVANTEGVRVRLQANRDRQSRLLQQAR